MNVLLEKYVPSKTYFDNSSVPVHFDKNLVKYCNSKIVFFSFHSMVDAKKAFLKLGGIHGLIDFVWILKYIIFVVCWSRYQGLNKKYCCYLS